MDTPNPLITPADLSALFSDLQSILPVNVQLLSELETRMKSTDDSKSIGDIFLKLVCFTSIALLGLGLTEC